VKANGSVYTAGLNKHTYRHLNAPAQRHSTATLWQADSSSESQKINLHLWNRDFIARHWALARARSFHTMNCSFEIRFNNIRPLLLVPNTAEAVATEPIQYIGLDL
jgi:hypothetical protein